MNVLRDRRLSALARAMAEGRPCPRHTLRRAFPEPESDAVGGHTVEADPWVEPRRWSYPHLDPEIGEG